MTPITITINKPHELQDKILRDKTRFRVLCIGRRWGKTETLIIALIYRLMRGETVWFTSPTNRNNKAVFRKLKKIIRDFPEVRFNNSELSVSLPNGGWAQFLSLHEPDNLRGEGLNHIFIDEAGFIKDGIWDNVLRAMLATTGGGATFASTPNGTGNDFHRLYLKGLNPDEIDWVTYHLPSNTSPLIPEAELEAIKRDTPERAFRQEYLAEFLDDGGAVFRNILSCIMPAPETSARVVFGVDWGRVNDYTAIIALDADTGAMLALERFNKIDWLLQRGRLTELYNRYKPFVILAESNSIGEPNIEELRRQGLPVRGFKTTNQSKAEIINSLALAFEQNDIGILNDENLISELKAFTIERLASGLFRYTAPAGLHDDTVIALALANKARSIPAKVFI